MENLKIGFIGLGNMAGAMVSGLVKNPQVKPENIFGYDVVKEVAEQRKQAYGISLCESIAEVVEMVDYVVFAVKPQYIGGVLEEIAQLKSVNPVYISIVAGKTIGFYEEHLGKKVKIVRCMPNTPAMVGEGITGVSPSKNVAEEELQFALTIIRSFGRASVVPESLMDAVVGVSGSAPAYVFMFIEAMADGAVAAGMPRAQAYEFAAQAVYGSAKLMLETGKHPGELKDMVCSPAGTTIEAVRVLEEAGFRASVMDAVLAAAEKSKNL